MYYSDWAIEVASVHLNKHCAVEEVKKECEETRAFLSKHYPEEYVRYFSSENEDEFSVWVPGGVEYFEWSIEEHTVKL